MLHKLFLLGIFLVCVLGCGILDRATKEAAGSNSSNVAANINENKTLTDKAIDTAVGEQKIGIVECDEAMDMLLAQADNPDDNFVIKAAKKSAASTFRDRVKKSMEEHKTDKTAVAKFCKDFRDNLEGSMTEANANIGK
jgi:hypothetical protein